MFFWCDVSLPLDVHDFCRLSEKVGLPMQIPQENSPFFLLQNHTIPFPSNLNTHRTSKKDSFPKGNPPPLSESGASKFFGAGLACSVRCCFQPNQPTNQPTKKIRIPNWRGPAECLGRRTGGYCEVLAFSEAQGRLWRLPRNPELV